MTADNIKKGALTLYISILIFCLYSCIFAFRKPFTVGSYGEQQMLGISYQTLLIISQVVGYMLSKFVGMLTDSRSFLSFPRHEYFRRLLCNMFGDEIENGELPNDIAWIGQVIQDICFNNAKNYFNW